MQFDELTKMGLVWSLASGKFLDSRVLDRTEKSAIVLCRNIVMEAITACLDSQLWKVSS